MMEVVKNSYYIDSLYRHCMVMPRLQVGDGVIKCKSMMVMMEIKVMGNWNPYNIRFLDSHSINIRGGGGGSTIGSSDKSDSDGSEGQSGGLKRREGSQSFAPTNQHIRQTMAALVGFG